LKKAVIELNEVLGCEPEINPKGTSEQLVKGIKAAIKLLTPADEFTEETEKVLAEFKPVSNTKGAAPTKKGKPAPVVDEDDDVEDDEPTPVPAKKSKKAPVVVEEDDDDEDKEEVPAKKGKEVEEKSAKKNPFKRPEGQRTKKAVVEEMLKIKGGTTIEEIAKKITDEGIDSDYKKNIVVVKLWLSKMGYPTNKAAIEANPKFKAKK
jgi:hypothetical protein